jgi:hypothetical protein
MIENCEICSRAVCYESEHATAIEAMRERDALRSNSKFQIPDKGLITSVSINGTETKLDPPVEVEAGAVIIGLGDAVTVKQRKRITDFYDVQSKTISQVAEYGDGGVLVRFTDESFIFLQPFAENDGGAYIETNSNLHGIEI